ncbi:MAG: DUF3105 domain-containing protein [Armatimonadota bacterium]|nr:DUF3105 domain-containing protein [Armatimonadota bacterium]MDR7449280.1 DUF3105 domain-containing protein [Armatimonadota bacterium]MDR7459656.1 DUF3105 domain-containing protein [Armatimonadota bacterium]MDR7480596.1 DUF3105 domain-containing protein [Armatimonadota bacterium]MDR7488166.1 DUF3105 domain-containing protein [Armatimonadota bacterium]
MAKKDARKAEERRRRREERRAAERAAAARRRRVQALTWGGGTVLLIALLAWVATGSLRTPYRVPTVPPSHIAPGTRATGYATNPPTSGPHWPTTAPWGVHTEVLPDELLVHNLEHGGVWISYRNRDDRALADRLTAIAGRYRTKVIVTPRPANDVPIALAAWGRLLKLQAFDEATIVRFIDAHRGRVGPERNAP